jgi:hypothetical protein
MQIVMIGFVSQVCKLSLGNSVSTSLSGPSPAPSCICCFLHPLFGVLCASLRSKLSLHFSSTMPISPLHLPHRFLPALIPHPLRSPPHLLFIIFLIFVWFILPPLSMLHAHPDLFLPCCFLLLGTPLLFAPLTLPPCCSSLTLFAVPEHQCLPAPSKSSTISVFRLRGQV